MKHKWFMKSWKSFADIARLLAENERLRAALLTEPVLTAEQEEELTGVHFSAILPRIEIFKLGWRTALEHIRRSIGNEQTVAYTDSGERLAEIERLHTENDRLRAALRDIADGADAKAFVKATALKALAHEQEKAQSR